MALLLIVMIGQVEKWVPGLTGLPLAKVTFLFTLFYTYRHRQTLVPVRVTSLRIARPFLAFFVLAILSMFFSIYKSGTMQLIIPNTLLLIAFVVLVKITRTMRDVETMIRALAASALLLVLGVLLNYKGGRAHINSNFDPNDVAYCLDTLLPIVVAVGAAGRLKRVKWLTYGILPIIAFAILLTGSLGGVIGFAVVVVVMIVNPIGISMTGGLKEFALRRVILQISLIAILGVTIWGYLPPNISSRLSEITDLSNNYNMGDSQTSRSVIWRTQLRLALERPIGYGAGSASTVDGKLGGGAWFTSHNSPLQAFVELGALGLFLFLYTYYIMWKELGVVVRNSYQSLADCDSPEVLLYARGFRIALMGNIAAGFFLSEAYSPCMWMLVAVCAVFVRVATARYSGPQVRRAIRDSAPSDLGKGKVRGSQLCHEPAQMSSRECNGGVERLALGSLEAEQALRKFGQRITAVTCERRERMVQTGFLTG